MALLVAAAMSFVLFWLYHVYYNILVLHWGGSYVGGASQCFRPEGVGGFSIETGRIGGLCMNRIMALLGTVPNGCQNKPNINSAVPVA